MNDMGTMEKEALEAGEDFRSGANKAKQRLEDAGSRIKSKAEDAWEDFSDLVKRHPGKALGIALTAGVALGSLAALSRCRRYSSSERLQDLAGTGADAWQRVTSGFGDAVATLKDAIEDAAAKFK